MRGDRVKQGTPSGTRLPRIQRSTTTNASSTQSLTSPQVQRVSSTASKAINSSQGNPSVSQLSSRLSTRPRQISDHLTQESISTNTKTSDVTLSNPISLFSPSTILPAPTPSESPYELAVASATDEVTTHFKEASVHRAAPPYVLNSPKGKKYVPLVPHTKEGFEIHEAQKQTPDTRATTSQNKRAISEDSPVTIFTNQVMTATSLSPYDAKNTSYTGIQGRFVTIGSERYEMKRDKSYTRLDQKKYTLVSAPHLSLTMFPESKRQSKKLKLDPLLKKENIRVPIVTSGTVSIKDETYKYVVERNPIADKRTHNRYMLDMISKSNVDRPIKIILFAKFLFNKLQPLEFAHKNDIYGEIIDQNLKEFGLGRTLLSYPKDITKEYNRPIHILKTADYTNMGYEIYKVFNPDQMPIRYEALEDGAERYVIAETYTPGSTFYTHAVQEKYDFIDPFIPLMNSLLEGTYTDDDVTEPIVKVVKEIVRSLYLEDNAVSSALIKQFSKAERTLTDLSPHKKPSTDDMDSLGDNLHELCSLSTTPHATRTPLRKKGPIDKKIADTIIRLQTTMAEDSHAPVSKALENDL